MNTSGADAIFETAERLFRVDEGGDEPDDIVFLEGVPLACLAVHKPTVQYRTGCLSGRGPCCSLSGWTSVRQMQGILLFLLCCHVIDVRLNIAVKANDMLPLIMGASKVCAAELPGCLSQLQARRPCTGDEEAVYVYADLAEVKAADMPKAGSEVTLRVRPLLGKLRTDRVAWWGAAWPCRGC